MSMYDSLISQSLALAWCLAGAWLMFAKVENFTSASLSVFALGSPGPDICSL